MKFVAKAMNARFSKKIVAKTSDRMIFYWQNFLRKLSQDFLTKILIIAAIVRPFNEN